MFKWIEKLLNKEFKSAEAKPEGVSEPVISFVEEFKRRPHTFQFRAIYPEFMTMYTLHKMGSSIMVNAELLDKLTRERWRFSFRLKSECVYMGGFGNKSNVLGMIHMVLDVHHLPDWMTPYETRYLKEEMKKAYLARIIKIQKRIDRENKRREDKLEQERNEANRNERARLTAIYAGENHG